MTVKIFPTETLHEVIAKNLPQRRIGPWAGKKVNEVGHIDLAYDEEKKLVTGTMQLNGRTKKLRGTLQKKVTEQYRVERPRDSYFDNVQGPDNRAKERLKWVQRGQTVLSKFMSCFQTSPASIRFGSADVSLADSSVLPASHYVLSTVPVSPFTCVGWPNIDQTPERRDASKAVAGPPKRPPMPPRGAPFLVAHSTLSSPGSVESLASTSGSSVQFPAPLFATRKATARSAGGYITLNEPNASQLLAEESPAHFFNLESDKASSMSPSTQSIESSEDLAASPTGPVQAFGSPYTSQESLASTVGSGRTSMSASGASGTSGKHRAENDANLLGQGPSEVSLLSEAFKRFLRPVVAAIKPPLREKSVRRPQFDNPEAFQLWANGRMAASRKDVLGA